ncbi:sensor histidine kinase [Kordiimonas laminariae]|uniref:sensor histidine kinase n=1 Tax=Kordiimonas laminariae TaxID=2917717 RepID=UPI001FF5B0E7|nr:sensor histidine kinase [Kordiimonas laminariae]
MANCTDTEKKSWFDSPYPWLGYLFIYFFPWVFRAPTSTELIYTAFLIPAFLVIYLVGTRKKGADVLPFIASLIILTVIGSPVMLTSNVFAVYAAAMAGYIEDRRLAIWTLVVIVVITAGYGMFMGYGIPFIGPAVFFMSMTGGACIAGTQFRAKNEALKASQEEVRAMAVQVERERIARDMHDVLGHTLSLISVKSELAGKLVDHDPVRAKSEIEDIHSTARKALADVRATITGMKSHTLVSEIAAARQALSAADISLNFVNEQIELPSSLENAVAMVIREAVTNIVRHAGAERCTVKITGQGDDLLLSIEDDGCGKIKKEGNGLKGMRERIEALGGYLNIMSEEGTRIEAAIPLAEVRLS